jgi:RNA polymerase sigma factor (sigma-70 family)
MTTPNANVAEKLLIQANRIPQQCAAKHRRWCRAGCDPDDLSQVARIAIVKAAPKYQAMGKFESWAWRVSNLAVLDHHRQTTRYRMAVLRFAEVQRGKKMNCELDPETIAQLQEELLLAVEQLEGLDRDIMRLWIFENASAETISSTRGLSANEVYRRIQNVGRDIGFTLRNGRAL